MLLAVLCFVPQMALPGLWTSVVMRLEQRLPAYAIRSTQPAVAERILNKALAKIPAGLETYPTANGDAYAHVANSDCAVALVRGFDYFALDGGCLVLLSPRPGGVKCELLAYGETGEPVWPDSARLVGGFLVVVGSVGWPGNGPLAAIACYRRSRTGWRQTGYAESFGEYVERPTFVAKNASTLQEVSVVSLAYPDNLDVCHAMANVAFRETWRFDNGRFVLISKLRFSTPLACLDDLVGACRRGNGAQVRRLSADGNIAKRALEIFCEGHPGTLGGPLESEGDVRTFVFEGTSDSMKDYIVKMRLSQDRWVVSQISVRKYQGHEASWYLRLTPGNK